LPLRLNVCSRKTFTFRPFNERRLLQAEADQALTSGECQKQPFGFLFKTICLGLRRFSLPRLISFQRPELSTDPHRVPPRRYALLLHQLGQQALGCLGVAVVLDDLVEDVSVLLDSPPKPVFSPSDSDDHLIQMPDVIRARLLATEAPGKSRSNFLPHRRIV
jgi:hypothetical protein